MRRGAFSDELLNAYVDGELGSVEAAALAHRVVQDTDVAARVAMLHQMKAGVATLAHDSICGMPPDIPAPARRAGWGAAAVVAACVAVLVLAAGTAWLLRPPADGPTTGAQVSFDPLVAGHDRWSAAFADVQDDPVAPEWLEGVMAATGLRLVHAAPSMQDQTRVMHYAFVGTNDCRLSLFETALPGEVDLALAVDFADDLLTARWQMHGFGYTMVARNMDRQRFTTIAAAVLDVTRIRQPVEGAIIASLRAARQRCTV
ncbi:MAG: hypothetical protein HLUCCA12_07445 [Rhodobacteraceae bacterium HLUCCA12]|nr:MAG: hypothetical protein HLUCCA12_07445 [Rhodobacteraceae bacterium HLUCCA12]